MHFQNLSIIKIYSSIDDRERQYLKTTDNGGDSYAIVSDRSNANWVFLGRVNTVVFQFFRGKRYQIIIFYLVTRFQFSGKTETHYSIWSRVAGRHGFGCYNTGRCQVFSSGEYQGARESNKCSARGEGCVICDWNQFSFRVHFHALG